MGKLTLLRLTKGQRKFHLQTVLVGGFVIQVAATVALVSYLSFQNGQKAVGELVERLNVEVSDRICQHLQRYLESTRQLATINANILQEGILNPRDSQRLSQMFWKQVQLYPVSYISYGASSGEFIGAGYSPGEAQITVSVPGQDNRKIRTYTTNSQGQPKQLLSATPYNFQSESWYREAVKTGQPLWSPVFKWDGSTSIFSMAYSVPILYQNRPVAVIGVDQRLDQISSFLQQLEISPGGETFVLERNGLLVASSSQEKPYRLVDGKEQRLPAIASQNSLIRQTAQALLQKLPSFKQIQESEQFEFWVDGERQIVRARPWGKSQGLDWIVVVAVPEADFTAQINAATYRTLLLCGLAFTVAILFGMVTARWISQPIQHVVQAAERMAAGELEQQVEARGIVELEKLADSFNSMTAQIRNSFTTLAGKNADLQQAKEELAGAKAQLEAILDAVPGSISWISADGIYLGVNQYLAQRLKLPAAEMVGKELGFGGTSQFVTFMRGFLASDRLSASQEITVQSNGQEFYYLIAAQKYQQGSIAVSVGLDITKQHQVQERLRIAEENYRGIYENALEGIYQATPTGQYISVNPSMARIYGYSSPQEMVARISDIRGQLYLNPEDYYQFQSLMATHHQVQDFEYRSYRQDGTVIWIEETTRAVYDNSGKLLYYEGLVEDITARKRLEEELRNQLIELRIEIDQQKREQDVALLTQDSFFQELQAEIAEVNLDEFWS